MNKAFNEKVNEKQIQWRSRHVDTCEHGWHNSKQYPWILPRDRWEDGLWPGIRASSEYALQTYIDETGIQKHRGLNNLKSSWVLCANLYFAHRRDPRLLARFFAENIDRRIVAIERLDLEYAEKRPLDPATLLGEQGRRGANQTSPDIAFIVKLEHGGCGLILTENKFTEHSFNGCSGRKKKCGNPDPKRCLFAEAVIDDPASQCHLLNWESGKRKNRQYWKYLKIGDSGRRLLQRCPAATAGYQLFRQQALAEAIAQKGKYNLVVTSVAYDDRNVRLTRSMKRTGIQDFPTEWGALFDGQAKFTSFTHQNWVRWVRKNDADNRWTDWLGWVNERYGY